MGKWQYFVKEAMPSRQKIFDFFKFQMHSGAFSYTSSEVLFAIMQMHSKVRYHTVFLATDGETDVKTSKFSSIS